MWEQFGLDKRAEARFWDGWIFLDFRSLVGWLGCLVGGVGFVGVWVSPFFVCLLVGLWEFGVV